MRFKGLVSGLGICSAIIISSFMLTNCTCHISQEDLAKIKDLRKQERSLDESISDAKKKVSRLEGELSSRKTEVNKCNENKEFIKKKLSQWPNVWPDYSPEPPAEPETE